MIAQTPRNAVPERALRIDSDLGRRCSGWASGVVGVVDRRLSGPANHSSAQAVITQTPRDAVPERALQIAAEVGRGRSGCVSGVMVLWLRSHGPCFPLVAKEKIKFDKILSRIA